MSVSFGARPTWLMWHLLQSALLVSVRATLVANELGVPTDYTTKLCKGRSPRCRVVIDVPRACAGSISYCPLVFFLHGGRGSGVEFYAHPHYSATKYVHNRKCIGIYPTGDRWGISNKTLGWNDGDKHGNKCAWNDYDCDKDPNDTQFIANIIAFLARLGGRGHVYAYGMSNGAALAQKLAANAGVHLPIKGIWASSTQLLRSPGRSGPGPFNYNKPRRSPVVAPVAYVACHGTEDQIVPYAGGHSIVHPKGFLHSEEDSTAFWAHHNGCYGRVEEDEMPAVMSTGGNGRLAGTAIHSRFHNCPPTAPVELYKVVGAGHGDALALDGRHKFGVVMDFFQRVEHALQAEAREDRHHSKIHLGKEAAKSSGKEAAKSQNQNTHAPQPTKRPKVLWHKLNTDVEVLEDLQHVERDVEKFYRSLHLRG